MAVTPVTRQSFQSNIYNPFGSSQWTNSAGGGSTFKNTLSAGNQNLYNTATSGLTDVLKQGAASKAPTLIDNAGGLYSKQLADTIFQRTWGTQQNDINEQRAQMQARLAEQGFTPGNEGYLNEMNRWEDNLGEMRQSIAQDAQITAANQALAEAGFTNDARTQGFENSARLRQQMIDAFMGTRNDMHGLVDQMGQQQQTAAGYNIDAGNLANAQTQTKYNYDLGLGQNANQKQSIANQYDLGLGDNYNQAQSIANQFQLGSQQNQTAAQQVANTHKSSMTGHQNTAQQIANQLKLGLGSNTNQAQQIENQRAYQEWLAKSGAAQGKNAQQNDLVRALLQWGIG